MIKCFVDDFPFDRLHFFNSLKKYGFYEGELKPNTTHILFIDTPERSINMINELMYYKSLNIKIVFAFYDEARFRVVDELIKIGVVDKLILFDKQYQNRFDIDTYISDYFVNEELFPITKSEPIYDKKCYYGNLINRVLDDNTEYIEIESFEDLYKKIQEYKKFVVIDVGRSENGYGIIHHNKAKFVESLMCGVPTECDSGIKTINYDKFINMENIDINEIREINRRVINDFVNNLKDGK